MDGWMGEGWMMVDHRWVIAGRVMYELMGGWMVDDYAWMNECIMDR